MTLQELYQSIDGNYDRAVQIMRMEKLIARYISKFPNSGVNEALQEAGKTLDPTRMFETAHAMKGVCANMGFDRLSAAAGDICEEFRPGNARSVSDDEIRARLSELDAMYQRTVEAIHAFERQ